MSSVWLLSWNPKNWKWDKYSEWCVGTKSGERFIESWTCHSKKPAIGDEFYLIKLGEKPRGLIGHGYIARESYMLLIIITSEHKREKKQIILMLNLIGFSTTNWKNMCL